MVFLCNIRREGLHSLVMLEGKETHEAAHEESAELDRGERAWARDRKKRTMCCGGLFWGDRVVASFPKRRAQVHESTLWQLYWHRWIERIPGGTRDNDGLCKRRAASASPAGRQSRSS